MGRMFRGSGEVGNGELDLGIGAIAVLLIMPGTLASLLMISEYGSLMRFLRGQSLYDPFTATISDEYFFIVLSFAVTGAVALWRWDAIFLDKRDYVNLLPLPVSLREIFLANLCAVISFAAILTVLVNAVSMFLFPVAVLGSQPSLSLFLRFAAGHCMAVFLASIFSFCAVFALAGLLITILPSSFFHRVSLLIRFVGGIAVVFLLASSFTATDWLKGLPLETARWVAMLPPISFLGVARTVWGRGNDRLDVTMTRGAVVGLGVVVAMAIAAYSISFRRSFMRIPEMSDAGPLPHGPHFVSPLAPVHGLILHLPSQRACYQFAVRTLLRSQAQLQVLLGFAALGVVLAAEPPNSAGPHFASINGVPPVGALAVPFVLSYCLLVGIRLAFEVPADLRANWVFRMWLDPIRTDARAVARKVLLGVFLRWFGPVAFVSVLMSGRWSSALLHTLIWATCTVIFAEIVIIRFRKIPFTCPYPNFQSSAPVKLLLYLAGFFIFADYLPRFDQLCLINPEQTIWLLALAIAIYVVIYIHHRNILDEDKGLIFEEETFSGF